MQQMISLKKGLHIPLKGAAVISWEKLPAVQAYGLMPADFPGVVPRLLVREGDTVKAGSPLFCDKNRPEVCFTSPVSGVVEAVVRGEKRRILEVVVRSDGKQESLTFMQGDPEQLSPEQIREALLSSGLWPSIVQRPYGVVADPSDSPRDIFISCFDTAPLAGDLRFMMQGSEEDFQKGLMALGKLTSGKVWLGVSEEGASFFGGFHGVECRVFRGLHPAGNVGVQIHHLAPVNKGETVWTVKPQEVVLMGRLFRTGGYDPLVGVALTGSEMPRPAYVKLRKGARLWETAGIAAEQEGIRVISGNVLTGTRLSGGGFLGYYDTQVTAIPEGNEEEFLGWMMPGLKKFSVSRSFLSWIMPRRKYALNANLNGGERAFVFSGVYEKVVPMDIFPVFLLKAILAGDVEKMEQLGIYEVVEEDLALCEFVCPSKTEVQRILRQGLDLVRREMS